MDSKLTARVAETNLRRHHDGPLDDRVIWIVVGGRRSTARGAAKAARVHVIRLYEETDETRGADTAKRVAPRPRAE